MILNQLNENTNQGQQNEVKNEVIDMEANKNALNNATSNANEGYQLQQLPMLGSKIKELTEEAAEILRQEEQKRENHQRKKELKETGLFNRIGDAQDRIIRGSSKGDCNENFNKEEEDCNNNRKTEENDNKDLNGKCCGVQTITMVVNNKKKKKEARVVFKLSSSHKLSRSSSPSQGSPLKTQNQEIHCEISNAQESSSHLPFESILKPLYSPSKQATRGHVSSPSRQQQLQQQPQQQQLQEQPLQHQNRFEKLVKNQRAIFTKTFSAATQDETPPRNTEQNYYKQQQQQYDYQAHSSRCSQSVAEKKMQMQQQIRYKPAGYFEISPVRRAVDFQQEAI